MSNFGKVCLGGLAMAGLVVSILTLRGGARARADDAKTTTAATFRCERLSGGTLKDLKAAMIENCNLDKNFSIAGMDSLNSSYTYCCHTK